MLNQRWLEIPFRLVASSRRTVAKLGQTMHGQTMHGQTPADFP